MCAVVACAFSMRAGSHGGRRKHADVKQPSLSNLVMWTKAKQSPTILVVSSRRRGV